jgi:hypothetical protein
MTFNLSLHGSDLRFSSSSGLVDFQDSNLWGCSITISCKTFLDVAISRRSLELLVGLLATTKGNDDLRETLDSTISEQYRKMLEALTLKES